VETVEKQVISPAQLRDAYHRVVKQIESAAQRAGKRAGHIAFVAVTKNATPDQIRMLVEMGHSDLGESRVQKLAQRVPQLIEFMARKKMLGAAVPKAPTPLPEKVRWHMVGHMQRNKVKQILPLVSLVHSIDSLRLAEEIHNLASRQDQVCEILIQVNTAGEQQKSGVAAPAVLHLAEQIDTMMHLRLRGLMTMAPYSDDPEDARPIFNRTAEIFHDIRHEKIGGQQFNILSMGMSGDFEVAIEEGANLVRIGRALFGDTPG
jgi:pyridoxal phosphate enzyme (YggS family)